MKNDKWKMENRLLNPTMSSPPTDYWIPNRRRRSNSCPNFSAALWGGAGDGEGLCGAGACRLGAGTAEVVEPPGTPAVPVAVVGLLPCVLVAEGAGNWARFCLAVGTMSAGAVPITFLYSLRASSV